MIIFYGIYQLTCLVGGGKYCIPILGEFGGVVLSMIDFRSIMIDDWSSVSFEPDVVSPEQILTSYKKEYQIYQTNKYLIHQNIKLITIS